MTQEELDEFLRSIFAEIPFAGPVDLAERLTPVVTEKIDAAFQAGHDDGLAEAERVAAANAKVNPLDTARTNPAAGPPTTPAEEKARKGGK